MKREDVKPETYGMINSMGDLMMDGAVKHTIGKVVKIVNLIAGLFNKF